jgi:hypothetical protein
MNVTIMSLAGSALATVKTEPDWLVSSIIECAREKDGKLNHHTKLIFEGCVMLATQSVAEIGLFDGALLYAIQMQGAQPGSYRGFYKEQDDYAEDRLYIHTSYMLDISDDGTFVLERAVCSNVNSVLPGKAFNGLICDDGAFKFVDQLDEDLTITVGSCGRPQLLASVDTIDGDVVSVDMPMKPCDETSWSRQSLARIPLQ